MGDSDIVIDSYQKFLDYYCINKQSLFEWGISTTIFPSISKVELEWSTLKERIFNNKLVYIRGYGRDAHATQLYKNLYIELINNSTFPADISKQSLNK